MRVLLNGGGYENRGAEAMLRTVRAELGKRIPDMEFYLWRLAQWDAHSALASGMNPLPLPIDSPNCKWHLFGRYGRELWSMRELMRTRSVNHFAAVFGRKKRFSKACEHYLRRAMKSVDGLVDISGFAYGDSFWEVGGFEMAEPLLGVCKDQDKPAIFLPQAWGGFAKAETRDALRQMASYPNTVMYSRDEISSRHLEKALGKPEGSIVSYPDIAFRFSGGTPDQGGHILRSMGCSMKRPIVGISPNLRVFDRVPGEGTGNAYLQSLVMLARHLLRNHDVDVVLQANEISGNRAARDDRYLCSLIAGMVNQPDRCFMTTESLSAEATKALIGQFEFLVGSRFHSLVFALSQGVPGMSISWFHKYKELFSLFGMEDAVLESGDLHADTLIQTFEHGWSKRQERRPLILATVTELQATIDSLFDDVAAKFHNGRY